jgi:hypothetical protein
MKINFRAQVSLFVIISLIIAVIGIILFMANSHDLKLYNDEKSSYKVKKFVESCMDQEVQKAQREIGLHGGWLYHPNMIFAKMGTNPEITKIAQGYEDLGGIKIPYWYYYDDSSDKFVLNIPSYDDESKYSLKNQVKRYVEENLDKDCLQGFRSFDNVYKINYEPRKVKVDVEFDKDKIITSMNLPLEIIERNTNNTEYVEDFESNVENKLYVPYNLAKYITYAEMNSSFLENRILSIMAPYQTTTTRDLLPPFYDFELKYDFKPWYVNDVEKRFKQIMSSNIGLIQFFNTNYKERKIPSQLENNDFAKRLYSIYTKNYIGSYVNDSKGKKLLPKFKDYTVTPTYNVFYPLYFNLAPSYGNVVLMPRPQAIINLIPFFFTEYVAVYQISMPVLFKIKNSENPNDNFVFNLALEANIDHNLPKKENVKLNLNNLKKFQMPKDQNLICNPVQFISKKVYINISDPVNHGNIKYDKRKNKIIGENGVSGAIVTFDCKSIAKCFIGTTTVNQISRDGNKTVLNFSLPINCDPGTLKIYKYGYKTLEFDNLNPNLNTPINLGNVYMPSKKKFHIQIREIEPSESRYSTGRGLGPHDTGILIFENLDDKDDVEVVSFNYSNYHNISVNLFPSNYTIKGFVFHNDTIHIPSEHYCYKSGLFSGKKCFDVPELNLKMWIVAAYQRDVEIDLSDILYKNKIIIPFNYYGVPSSYDDLKSMSDTLGDVKDGSKNIFFE